MKIARIDSEICQREEECEALLACPIGAIFRSLEGVDYGPSSVDEKRCLGCGKCIRFCSPKAISI